MQVFLALGQSGISNFALVQKKIKKKCPLSQPISMVNLCSMFKEPLKKVQSALTQNDVQY